MQLSRAMTCMSAAVRSPTMPKGCSTTSQTTPCRSRLTRPPRGYSNGMAHDPKQAPAVRQLFTDFGSGLHSLSGLAARAQIAKGAVLAFAERTLADLVGSWNRASTLQKQRLQRVIFPEGVTWDGSAVGTAITASVFAWIDPISDEESGAVGPPGLEPGTTRL
jgi:hypothetical protein